MAPKYEDYKGIIWELARRYARNGNLEEFVAEGNLVFVKAAASFQPDKSCFSTYLWRCLENRYRDLVSIKTPATVELDEAMPGCTPSPERTVAFRHVLSSLAEDVKEVAGIVLDTPTALLNETINKEAITRYLRSRGWQFERIWAAYNGIKNALQEV